MSSRSMFVRMILPFALAPAIGCATGGQPTPPIELKSTDSPSYVETGALVQVGELGFVVPAEGETVYAEGVRLDGSTVIAGIQRDSQGYVTAVLDEHPRIDDDLVAYACANPGECNDTARNAWDGRWDKPYSWRLNETSIPAGYDKLKVRDDITRSADNWTTGRNTCGIADQAGGPNHAFDRVTTTKPNMNADAVCGGRDKENVIGFGELHGYLAYACVWWNGFLWWSDMTEADVLISNSVSIFVGGAVPSGCSNKYGLRQIMTHEMGHVFGFGHVDECGHADLTMSPILDGCSLSNETLGKGDMLGVNDKY